MCIHMHKEREGCFCYLLVLLLRSFEHMYKLFFLLGFVDYAFNNRKGFSILFYFGKIKWTLIASLMANISVFDSRFYVAEHLNSLFFARIIFKTSQIEGRVEKEVLNSIDQF